MLCVDFQLCRVGALNTCVGQESIVIYTSDHFSMKSLFFLWKGFLPLFHLCKSKEKLSYFHRTYAKQCNSSLFLPQLLWINLAMSMCTESHLFKGFNIFELSIGEKKIILISLRWDIVKGDTWALLAVPLPTQQRRWASDNQKWTCIID